MSETEAVTAVSKGASYIQHKLMEEIEWAVGQFQAIRVYTQDGKIAAACADAEDRLKRFT